MVIFVGGAFSLDTSIIIFAINIYIFLIYRECVFSKRVGFHETPILDKNRISILCLNKDCGNQ